MLALRPHQQKLLEEAKDKQAFWLEMRCGKSPLSIRLAASKARLALVICPKSLKTQWELEVDKWNNNKEGCFFYVITKETFKRDWKLLPPYEAIIIDEVHIHFSSYKNQMFKALAAYKKRNDPRCIWILSGTPTMSTSWSIYTYGLILDRAWKWKDWDKHFFYKIKMGHRWIPQARTDRDKDLMKVIRALGPVLALKDIVDVPDDEDIIETFSMSKAQKDLIKESFDPLPIVRFTREHQINQGILKGDGYTEDISIPCEKDKRILELVEQNKKIIIVCRYHGQIRKFHDILRRTKRPIYEIHGQTKASAGEISVLAEQDPNAIVLVQSATGVGYSLQSFNTMVFASMDFSFTNFTQMKSRMKAMEKTRGCSYIYMLTEGDSVDQGVFDAVSRKQDFSCELFKKQEV